MSNRLFYVFAVMLITLSACSFNETPLFKTEVKTVNDKKALAYLPSMKFEQVSDSTFKLLEPKDFNKMIGGTMRIGAVIHENEKFSMRVLLLDNYSNLETKYQMILRTYSKDLRIVDSFIIANTTGNVTCEGFISNDLKVYKECDDDNNIIAQVDEYGEFIIQE